MPDPEPKALDLADDIERVARAIVAAGPHPQEAWQNYEMHARAALRAVSQPTPPTCPNCTWEKTEWIPRCPNCGIAGPAAFRDPDNDKPYRGPYWCAEWLERKVAALRAKATPTRERADVERMVLAVLAEYDGCLTRDAAIPIAHIMWRALFGTKAATEEWSSLHDHRECVREHIS